MRYARLAMACLLLLLASMLPSIAALNYAVHDISLGDESWASAVNRYGQITGYQRTASGTFAGFVWKDGITTQINPPAGHSSVNPQDINNNGQVTGFTNFPEHAFIWQPGTPAQEFGDMRPTAINDSGDIVGYIVTAARPYIRKGNTIRELAAYSLDAIALDINNSGVVAGFSQLYVTIGLGSRYIFHAVVWENGVIRDLTQSNTVQSKAHSINDYGVVGGEVQYAGGNPLPCIWANNVCNTLALPNGYNSGYVNKVNNKGQAIGQTMGNKQGLFWDSDGSVIVLDALSGDTHSYVYGMNDNGMLVGYSWNAETGARACYWTPVPEPTSIVVLLAGLSSLFGLTRRRIE